MLLRFSLAILIIVLFAGCSEEDSENVVEEITTISSSLQLAKSNPQGISSVCGVIFQVSEYDTWLEEYNKRNKGTIIVLRNVNDPSLLVVFEGSNSQEMIEGRAAVLTDDEFLTAATAMGEPVVSYYDVQYMNPAEQEHIYYVALIFDAEDMGQLLASVERNITMYDGYGLLPMGIGNDPFNPTKVYMLLTLDDFVSFKKHTNSPRKRKRFARSLNLPEETLILNMTK